MARRGLAGILALVVALWLSPRSADATILSLTVPISNCQTATQTIAACYDTGFLNDQLVGATDPFIGGFPNAQSNLYDFTNAFNNWNAANGNLWQLVNGGTLPVTLGIDVGVSPGTFGGGLNPVLATLEAYSPVAGDPSLSQLVWTQALVTNYTPTSAGLLSPPAVTLDTYTLSQGSGGSGGAFQTACEAIPGQTPGANNIIAALIGPTSSGKAYCDPIYPFQYGSKLNGDELDGVPLGIDPFFDAPSGGWPSDSFRAVTLLSTVTFETNASGNITDRILTVYDGIEYGFNLSAPEPAALLLFGPAVGVLALLRRR